MRCRDHIALTLPSFLLRLALAVTFLWAGTGKLLGTSTVQGDNAARLANLGVSFIADVPEPDPIIDDTPDEPINPLPDDEANPVDLPTEQDLEIDQPANDPVIEPDEESADQPKIVSMRPVAQSVAPAVGSDFPEPMNVKNLYKIALLLDHSTNPGLTEDSQPIKPTMPQWMGSGQMPVYAAWATAITELAAGLFLLVGLLTRISALSLTIIMLVAIWTTNIGPAALQSSDAILGFIPNAEDLWSPASYSTILWQFALIVMSLSVVLLGAGPLSMDRLIFRPGKRDPYISGAPERNAPKHKPEPPAPSSDRTEFDRTPPQSPPPLPLNNPTP